MGPLARLPPAQALADAPSRFVGLGGVRVHYKKIGETGPALLFVPGWACDLTFWRYQAEALAHEARLLFVDLPGHGKSGRPQDAAYTHDLFVRALLAVMDDAGEPAATVVGHSAGGSVARHLARREPQRVRALALVDPTLTALFRDRAQLDELLALLRGADPNRVALALIAPMVARHTPAMAAFEIRMRMLLTPPHVRVSFLEEMADPALWAEDVLACPVTAVLSELVPDRDAQEALLRRIAPRLEVRRPAAGHFVMLTDPDVVTAAVRDLLAAAGGGA
ncbi:MAG: alpha/beta fold hydrolase [Vicinamibacteria bacterium]